LALILAFGVILLSLVRDNAPVDQLVDQLVAVATDQGFPFYRALGTIYRGIGNGCLSDIVIPSSR